MDKRFVGRFAPSPSGRMHLGNVLCALLSWLSVRSKNGRFLLRIEDLDQMRCPRSYAALIMEDLHWLGLDWDAIEMPAMPAASLLGHIPPHICLSVYQSDRTPIYICYETLLRQKNLLYPCFCSRAELHAANAPHLSDGSVVYSGKCRNLSPQQVIARAKTRGAATRVRVPDETITFSDGCMGNYTENLAQQCGDFIIRRSDGVFAYQLAVTVDDGLMGVTEVVRGHDLISSTARQIWLHQLFGFTPPKFYHIPLLLAPDGRRLSKRDEDLDLGILRTRMTPQALTGALAYAAGLLPKYQPVCPQDLIPHFHWDLVKKQDLLLPDLFR